MGKNVPIDAELPTYEVIEYEGKSARLYPDGSIRNERGHWLAMHPNSRPITSETARTMAQIRHEKARERVRARVMEEIHSIAPSVTTPEDAYAEIVAMQSLTLLDSQKPRFDDVEKLGQIMGTMPTRGAEAQQPADLLNGIADILRELASFARAVPPEVVDGTVSDAE